MKLTKIKLINWHLFSNMTIEVKGNFLITGENGSGKSTLVDAMYYLLSGGDSKRFNSAANTNSKRTLVNYIKGRTGNEGDEFIRGSQDIITHIAMEFYDEKANKTRLLGVVLELSQDNQAAPKISFYTCLDAKIDEDCFVQDNEISSFKVLKNLYKEKGLDLLKLDDGISKRKQTIAREILRLDDATKYADLLRNSIAFKPIDEVSSFVNDFLLRNDNINIDSLINEIRQYQDLQNQISKNKKKLELLEKFVHHAETYRDNEIAIVYLDILLSKAKISENKKRIDDGNRLIARLKDQNTGLKKDIEDIEEKMSEYRDEEKKIKSSESYQILKDKEDKLNLLEKEVDTLSSKIYGVTRTLNEEKQVIAKAGLRIRFKDDIDSGNFLLLKEHIRNLSKSVMEKINDSLKKNAEKTLEKDRLDKIIEAKTKELDDLKQGKSTYDDSVNNLRDILVKAIKKEFGKDVDIKPLCELIDIKDERWSNAIEGYLGFHRFDLVVDKKYYDFAIRKYEEVKNDCNISNVGIAKIDPKFIGHYTADEDTLFSKVATLNKFAESSAYNLLGEVYCSDGIDALKLHDTSVTDTVMVFKDNVTYNVDPEVYRYPFIGDNSITKRIDILVNEIKTKSVEQKAIQDELSIINTDIVILQNSKAYTLVDLENHWADKSRKENDVERLQAEIKALKKENGMLASEDRLKVIRDCLTELNCEKTKKNNELVANAATEQTKRSEIEVSEHDIEQERHVLSEKLGSLQNEYAYKEYEANYLKNNKLSSSEISSDKMSKQLANNKLQSTILSGMNEYSSNYNAQLTPKLEETQTFVDEYNRIKNYEMVKFETKAKEALDNCNTSFKENFLSKMRQKIETAKKQIREMNKTLEKNPFGNDQEVYEFISQPSKDDEMKEYYDIIMGGKDYYQRDLFTESLTEKEQDVIDRLLKTLVSEQDSPEGERKVKRYLDYRNYMVYDIKFTNKYGETQLFSKTNTEKSGGETQTPFYVVIAACFDRLFKKDVSAKESSACLVIFDEAFNNMDEGRISALMDYYKKLNIQVAVVVPSNRMSTLGGYMDTSIGLLRQGRTIREITFTSHE